MTDIVLHDIDTLLADRIRRLADANGWAMQDALMHLLEHGLFACESELKARFNDTDATALQAAILALEQVQDDPGFARIGRATPSTGATDAGAAAGVTDHSIDHSINHAIDQAG